MALFAKIASILIEIIYPFLRCASKLQVRLNSKQKTPDICDFHSSVEYSIPAFLKFSGILHIP